MNLTTERIRALNDALRHNLSLGHAVMTPGIAALGAEAVARIVKTIEVYDNFCMIVMTRLVTARSDGSGECTVSVVTTPPDNGVARP
jgi:hypothetical protein